MSEVQVPTQEKKIDSGELLRSLYSVGADQLYEEETGLPAIEDRVRKPEAQAYVDSLLAQIDFVDRSETRRNVKLELELSLACNRRLLDSFRSSNMS